MAQLTKMQQKIYDYIAQAIQDQGYPPSVREIGEAVGLKSPSTVGHRQAGRQGPGPDADGGVPGEPAA